MWYIFKDMLFNRKRIKLLLLTSVFNICSIVFLFAVPNVQTTDMTISGATGTGSVFITGDTIVVEWDSTNSPLNYAPPATNNITAVSVDFSQFGGAAAAAAVDDGSGDDAASGDGIWTASYTIVAGIIDSSTVRITVTVTNGDGTTGPVDNGTNLSCDNQSPTVTDGNLSISGATGTGSVFISGDTVTVTWNNTAGGDNNGDISSAAADFTEFGGGAAVAMANTAETWTASYALLDGIDTSNLNVSITATDDAGNTTTVADTSNADVDTTAPAGYTVAIADVDGYINASEVASVDFDFTGAEVGADYSYTYTSSGGGGPVTGSGTIATATDTINDDLSALNDGTVTLTVALTDPAGNTGLDATDTSELDVAAPGAFTAGAVTATGGTVTANYWNSTNTGLTVTIPIANDASLSGGTVQLQGFATGGAWENLAGAIAIGGGDINTNKDHTATAAQLEALTGFGEGDTVQLRAVITDVAGNSTTGSASATMLTVDQTAPAGYTVAIADVDGYINASEVASLDFDFTGAEVGADYSYTYTSSGGGGPVTGSGTIATATDTINDDLSALNDGTVTLTVALTDPAGNTGLDATDTSELDVAAPGAFTAGAVTATGGTVTANYWNSTNTGLTVTIPIANDASLSGGTVQLQGFATGGAWENLAGAIAIGGGDINTNKDHTATAAQLEALTGFGEGDTVQLRAVITDVAGNSTTGSASVTTLTVDQIIPTAFTAGAVTATGGTVTANYWNSTNTGLTVTIPIANDASLSGGTVQLQGFATGGAWENLAGAIAIGGGDISTNKDHTATAAQFEALTNFGEGDTVQLRAVITDIAGNSTTGSTSAVTLTVDQVLPTLAPVHIQSDNADTATAKIQDAITLTFTSSETLSALPVVTLTSLSRAATESSLGGDDYQAVYQLLPADRTIAEAAVAFTIDFSDTAGNAGTQVTAVTDASSVTFYRECNWGGSSGGDWSVAGNWVEGYVPAAADDVVIASGYPVLSVDSSGEDVIVSAGAELRTGTNDLSISSIDLQGTAILRRAGGTNVSATDTDSGTVRYTGGGAVQEYGVTDYFDLEFDAVAAFTVGTSLTTADNLIITNSTGVDFGAGVTVTAGSNQIDITSSTGTIRFREALTVGTLNVGASAYSVRMDSGCTITGAVNFQNTTSVRLSGTCNFNGGMSTGAPLTLNGDIITTADDVSVAGISLTGASGIDTGAAGGNIQISGVVAGSGANRDFTIDAGTGSVTLGGVLSSNINDLIITGTGAGIALPAITTAGGLACTVGGDITQGAALSISGAAAFEAGAGNDITLTNGSNAFNTVTFTNSANVDISEPAAFTVGAGASAYTGTLTLNAGTALTISGDITGSGAGAVSLTAGTGAMIINDGAVVDAGSGTISVSSGTDLTLGRLVTTSAGAPAVDITVGGEVIDGGDTGGSDIAAGGELQISALDGIGNSGANGAVETDVVSLDLSLSAAGDIDIIENNDVLILDITAANGNVTLTGGGAITVNANDAVADVSGNTISLSSNGDIGTAASSIELDISTALNADSTSANGDIYLDSLGVFPVGLIDAGAGDVEVTATGGITDASGDAAADIAANILWVNAPASFALDTSVSVIRGTVTGSFTVDEVSAIQLGNATGGISSGAGALSIEADGSITTGNTVSSGADQNLTLTTTGNGDTITLGHAVSAGGSGIVDINSGDDFTLNNGIVLGSGTGNITVDTLNGGVLTVNGSITTAGAGTINLTSVDAVLMDTTSLIQTVNGQIDVSAGATGLTVDVIEATGGSAAINLTAVGSAIEEADNTALIGAAGSTTVLTLSAGTDIGAGSALNTNVGTLVASAGGILSINEFTAIILGAGSGVTSSGGDVTIQTAGAITTGNSIATTGANGAITLTSTGTNPITLSNTVTANGSGNIDINSSSAFTLSNGVVMSSTSGDITIDTTGANVLLIYGNITTGLAGTIDITGTDVVTMDSVSLVQTAAGQIDMSAGANGLTVDVVESTGNGAINLTAAGDAIEEADNTARVGAVNSTTVLTLTAGTDIGTLNSLNTNVGSITASTAAAGDISIVEANNVTLTSITAASGDVNIVSTAGTVNVAAVSASGTVALTAASGSILEAAATDAASDITAGSISLTAQDAIGTSAAGEEIEIDLGGGSLDLTTTAAAPSGNINIAETNGALSSSQISSSTAGASVQTIIVYNRNAGIIVNNAWNLGNDNLELRAATAGDIAFVGGSLTTSGDISLESAAGGITDDDGTADIICGNLIIDADTGVGDANVLETTVSTVDLDNNTSGTVQITESNGLTINKLYNVNRAETLVSTTGSILIGNSVIPTISAGTSTVTLTAAAGEIYDSAAADTDIDINANTVDLNASTGIGDTNEIELASVTILTADTASGNIDIDHTADAGLSVTTMTTGGASTIDFDQTGNQSLTLVTVTASNGDITVTNTGGTGADTGLGSITADTADDTVSISASGAIDDSTASDTTADVTAAVIILTADDSGIGQAANGAVDVRAAVGLSADSSADGSDIALYDPVGPTPVVLLTTGGTGDIVLTSLNAVTDPGGNAENDISASDLNITAQGGINLDTAVSTMTLNAQAAGSVTIRETDAVTFTSVTASNGPVTLSTVNAGNIVLTNIVSSNDTDVNDISVTAANGDIEVDTIDAQGSNADISLTTANGAVTNTDSTSNVTGDVLTISTANGTGVSFGQAISTTVNTLNVGNSAGGDIAIDESGAVTVTGLSTVAGGNIRLDADGTITLNGAGASAAGAGGIILTGIGAGNNLDINAAINGGTGGITLTGGTSIDTNSNVTTSNNTIQFASNTYITDDATVTVSTGAGVGGTITFSGTLDGEGSDFTDNLTLIAGTGNIDFNAAVGSSVDMGNVLISSALDVTADAAFSANTLTQTAGTGDTQFDGAITLQALGGMDITTSTVTINSTINTLAAGNGGTVTITNAGLLDIAAGANMSLDGAFLQDGAGDVETAGNITTTNDSIYFTRNVTITDNGTVSLDTDAGAGTITFNGTLNGDDANFDDDLSLTAGTGNIDFNGIVGGANDLGDVSINSAADVTADLAFSANTLTQTAGTGDTQFDGAVVLQAAGGMDLTTNTVTINSTIDTSTAGNGGAVTITNAGLLDIAPGADISLDGAFTQDGAGAVQTAGNVTTTQDDIYFTSAVTVTDDESIVFDTDINDTGSIQGDLTFNSTVVSSSADTGILSLDSGIGTLTLNGVVGSGLIPFRYVLIRGAGNCTSTAATIDISAQDLYIDAGGYTLVLQKHLSADNLIFYDGTLNLNARTLTTNGDLAVFGGTYSAIDSARAATHAGNIYFAYPNTGALAYYPSAGTYNAGTAVFSTAPGAAFANLNGSTINAGGNFYVNGAGLPGTAAWNLIVNDNSTVTGLDTAPGDNITDWPYGTNYAVVFRSAVDYCNASNWLGVDPQNGNTDGGNNVANVDSTFPEIVNYETVFDNVIRVTFTEAIENDSDEISAAVSNVYVDGNSGLTFSASYIDADDAAPFNFTTTDGAGDLTTFYLQIDRTTATWNTDATGTSDGNTGSSDREGNHQAISASLSMLKGSLFDAEGHNHIRNYGLNTEDIADGSTNETFADECRPNLVAVVGGRVNHQAAASDEIYDGHNFLHLRYSEPVDIGDDVNYAIGAGAPPANDRADETFATGEHGGHIVQNGAVVDVVGYFSYTGTFLSGSRDGNPAITSMYRSGTENPSGDFGITLYVAGWRTDDTALWPGYLGDPAETLLSHSVNTDVTAGGVSIKALANSFIKDADGNTIEPSTEPYRGTDAIADPVITTAVSDILVSGTTSLPNISMPADHITGWDVEPPIFSVYDDTVIPNTYEIISIANVTTGKIERLEFFIRDNETSQGGFSQAIDAGIVHPEAGANLGVRDATCAIDAANSIDPYTAFFIADVNDTSLTAGYNTGITTTVQDSSIFLGPITVADDSYFALTLNDLHTWNTRTALQIKYDASIGYITDLAGNLIPTTSISLSGVERIPPYIELALGAVGDTKIYIRFSEPVFGAGYVNVAETDFSFSGTTNSLNGITAISYLSGGLLEAWFNLDSGLTADEILEAKIIPQATQIYDKLGNAMEVTSIHRFSDIGIGVMNPIWAADSLHNNSLYGTDTSLRIFDGTGYLTDSNITLEASILAADRFKGLSASLYYDVDPSESVLNDGFWLPSYNNALVPAANTSARGLNPYSSSEGTRKFMIPSDDSEIETGNEVQFLLKVGDLFCANLLDKDDPRTIVPWSFSIKDIKKQAAGVTILNNVINPVEGDEKTVLTYDLPNAGMVTINVFNMAGDLVKVIHRGAQGAGTYNFSWDGTNRAGNIVARGIYFIRIVAPGIDEYRKVMIVK